MEEQNNQPKPVEGSPVEGGASPKVKDELSNVASNPKQSMLIIIAGVVVALYMVYSIFMGGSPDDTKKIENVTKPKIVTQPTQQLDGADMGVMPALPKAPQLKDPVAAPIPQEKKAESTKSSIPTPPKLVGKTIAPPINKQPDSPMPPKKPDVEPDADSKHSHKLDNSFVPKSLMSDQDLQKKKARQKCTQKNK